ncbi:helix-turn-helix domain-containing protein [Pseudarthrobacter raffinosi]|uniref:helix-turn-helix domain-containing protein n=1 Tax=Pseudarthrobacter raffinosi TaxID=2953651 RepID=UPI0027E2245A|nr:MULTISPECIES: helix-turn-helix transcriptional regulator [unclassified Pseudarthrobacter]
MDETAELLGEHLKQWRIVLGLSQELAADRANLSMPTVRRIERGDTGVRLGSVLALTCAQLPGFVPAASRTALPSVVSMGSVSQQPAHCFAPVSEELRGGMGRVDAKEKVSNDSIYRAGTE